MLNNMYVSSINLRDNLLNIENSFSRKTLGKRTLGVGIIISGMFFNGAIYGYTSPALPSFDQKREPEQENFFDRLLPKSVSKFLNLRVKRTRYLVTR